MKLHSSSDDYKLYYGSMLDMAEAVDPCSIDSIVTDPPYELGFMNKTWDSSGIAFQKETWEKCYQVLKPGGYMLVFGGSRTFHRITCAIEDAGFEIRDVIMWLYGSGFPKGQNIGKGIEAKLTMGSANSQAFKNLNGTKVKSGSLGFVGMQFNQGSRPKDYASDGHLYTSDVDYTTSEGAYWSGWNTSLKPAYEPIIVARKPCEGSCTDNVLKYGVGGINIDECRIHHNESIKYTNRTERNGCVFGEINTGKSSFLNENNHIASADPNGRFPTNVILTYDDSDFDEVCGGMPYSESSGGATTMPNFKDAGQKNTVNKVGYNDGDTADRIKSDYISPIDEGSAARYFYCAKASNKDRDEGVGSEIKKNNHPTVKPCELMQYLVRLVTPNNGIVLDPFNGSGSTGKACMCENVERNKGYIYIGIELSEQYLNISRARIDYAKTYKYIPDVYKPINSECKSVRRLF